MSLAGSIDARWLRDDNDRLLIEHSQQRRGQPSGLVAAALELDVQWRTQQSSYESARSEKPADKASRAEWKLRVAQLKVRADSTNDERVRALQLVANIVHADAPATHGRLVVERAGSGAIDTVTTTSVLKQWPLGGVAGASLGSLQGRSFFARDLPLRWCETDTLYCLCAPGWDAWDTMRAELESALALGPAPLRVMESGCHELSRHVSRQLRFDVGGVPFATLDACTDYVCRTRGIRYGARSKAAAESAINVYDNGLCWMLCVTFIRAP